MDKCGILHVVAFYDGRPGHEKQTEGIIKALGQKAEINVTRNKLPKYSFAHLLLGTLKLFLFGNSRSQVEPERITTIAIGTGSRTHIDLLLFKQQFGVPAITCMLPSVHLRHRFDLCFVPKHDGAAVKNYIFDTYGAPNLSYNRNKHDEKSGLILLGGIDKKSHQWQEDRIAEMVEQIVCLESWKQWTISSSPRTPASTVSYMKQLDKDYANVKFFDYKETLPGWVEKEYDRNATVWVTSDSVSMIYEALTGGCRVGLLPVAWKKSAKKFIRNEKILIEDNLVITYADWRNGNSRLIKPCLINEAQRCADEILTRWMKEN